MIRSAAILFLLLALPALPALGQNAAPSPLYSVPLRSIPSSLPKQEASSSKFQVSEVDTELTVGMQKSDALPSVFDQLSPKAGNQQRAEVLLKRNILDEVTLSTKSTIGLADAYSSHTGEATSQSMQNQTRTELKWNVTDAWSIAGSNQMDQIFEFQKAAPNHTRNGIESRYAVRDGTSVGFGTASENYFDNTLVTLERQTTTGQLQQKLGKLPMNWIASPSLITENNPLDRLQNRDGSRLDQSILWSLNSNTSWKVGTSLTQWDYTYSTQKEVTRSLFSQWSRNLQRNLTFIFRTDYETLTDTQQESPDTREDRFKTSIGQQLKLTDDLSAAFDLRQEYSREINSTWMPTDHSATLSIQKKF